VALYGVNDAAGLEADGVVHRIAKPLLTAKVSLGGLDAHMAEQKLDLLKLPAGFVTQTGTCAPEVVRSNIL
jgi:hypothetical protein